MVNLTLDLGKVGAHVGQDDHGQPAVMFGIYLPGIGQGSGYQVWVRVIHKNDRFTQGIPPQDYQLTWQTASPYDYWSTTVPIVTPAEAGNPPSSFGKKGTYLYRYQLQRNDGSVALAWFADPFARATEIGEIGAFDLPAPQPFAWTDEAFVVPAIEDCVVYELQVEEFNDIFDGVVERLPYLQSLGVNVLELMPISTPKHEFDWGYGPLHFLAPSAKCGGPGGLKRLVDACHAAHIAVILDVVYQHIDPSFPYKLVYDMVGLPSPMIDGQGDFGPKVDWYKPFAPDYFLAANAHWLDEYHIDGFRYDNVGDNVDGYYFGVAQPGFAALAYGTYGLAVPYGRFAASGNTAAGPVRLIQCAESLSQPQRILQETYANAAWQNGLLTAADNLARAPLDTSALDTFAHALDIRFSGYPDTNGVPEPVAPFQYIDSHDHSYLLTYFGTTDADTSPGAILYGNRAQSYRLQPFAIALYTCAGVPMLWQGQELGECYTLPNDGFLRINVRRDVHWEFFYDDPGQALLRLYRTLGALRSTHRALRSREVYYDYALDSRRLGVVIYSRHAPAAGDGAPEETAVVCLNFSDQDQTVQVPFPQAGTYREMVDDPYLAARGAHYDVTVAAMGDTQPVTVPSHYGRVFVTPVA